jgi:hypothetical protein
VRKRARRGGTRERDSSALRADGEEKDHGEEKHSSQAEGEVDHGDEIPFRCPTNPAVSIALGVGGATW